MDGRRPCLFGFLVKYAPPSLISIYMDVAFASPHISKEAQILLSPLNKHGALLQLTNTESFNVRGSPAHCFVEKHLGPLCRYSGFVFTTPAASM